MNFGERILKLRNENNLTQDELATAVGYKSRSTIAKIESGERDAPQSMIVALAKALGTTPAYLMGWENAENQGFKLDYSMFEYLEKYIEYAFDEKEDRKTAYELIINLQNVNNAGLKELQKRLDELSRLKEYMSSSTLEAFENWVNEQAEINSKKYKE